MKLRFVEQGAVNTAFSKRLFTHVIAITKQAFNPSPIRVGIGAFPIGNVVCPFSFVDTAVTVLHNTITIGESVLELPCVHVTLG